MHSTANSTSFDEDIAKTVTIAGTQGQVYEVALDAVEWTDNGKLVNMAWAR